MLPITDPFAIVTILLAVEGLILWLSERPRLRRFFNIVPALFLIYFVPIALTAVGVTPPDEDAAGNKTAIYGQISRYCLPAALVLLMLGTNLRAILRLGPVALLVMLAGSAGVVLAMPGLLLLFRPILPEGIHGGFAALSASWTGGSANMMAVKEALNLSPPIFQPMIVIDSIVPYVWMSLLMFLAAYQGIYDRWNRSNPAITADLERRTAEVSKAERRPMTVEHLGAIAALAGLATFVCIAGSTWLRAEQQRAWMPAVVIGLGQGGLTIVLATTLGILLSLSPARRLEEFGASRLGYVLLYLVLCSYGAGTSLGNLSQTPVLLLVGLLVVVIHAVVIISFARLLRAPMSLVAAASQANLGGVASAPLVAQKYAPALMPVGLLLAIFGNIIGTYLGLLCESLCKSVGL